MGKYHIGLIVSLILLLVITACGSSTSNKSAATPAVATANSTTAPAQLTALIEAAKKEGKVVYNGEAHPEMSNAIKEAFQKKYNITVDYLTLTGGEFLTRIDREFKANQVSFDVLSSGSGDVYTMSTRGQVEDLKGVVIDTEVLKPTVWEKGYPLFYGGGPDTPKDYILGVQYLKSAAGQLYVNPDIIKEGDIKTWKDLLKPEYKGKIVAHDPRQPGIGQSTASAIIYALGEDYFKQLYLGQGITISKDRKQMAEWVIRGNYPIAVGITGSIVREFQDSKLPIKRIFPAEGPDALTQGTGQISILKGAPHPNAAKLFVNWMLTKEAQEILEKYKGDPSMRTDTETKKYITDFLIPRKDIEYKLHDGTADFHFNHKNTILQKINDTLGR